MYVATPGHTTLPMDTETQYGWGGKGYVQNLWVNYRLTTGTFNALFFDTQLGKCPGCERDLAHPFIKREDWGLRCEVDHKPGTDGDNVQVRGILCKRCNQFLAKIHDNQARLRNLADYLKRHGEAVI